MNKGYVYIISWEQKTCPNRKQTLKPRVIGLELTNYIEFAMEILGCLTTCQFPNSNSGGHDRTQVDWSWGVSLFITVTRPSHIHPCGWPALLSLLSKVIILMSVRVGLYPNLNFLRFSVNSTRLAMSFPFRPKLISGSYLCPNITRATIKEAPDECGCTGGDSM